MLQVDKVHKRYAETVALHDVSFTVQAGEMFGLLGPNGAGKTTLLSIISGLLAPTSGEVFLAGQRLTGQAHELRRVLGIVPQELAHYGELTAAENLAFVGKLYGLSGAALRERIDAVLALIGLEDRANHRAATFSGGMQRRLNLGMALVHQPQLLLLDEPTTGVDPQSRNHIFTGVRRLNAEGLTIVYTSHYMEEVQALCPRIGIIDHGQLIACDTIAGLLQQLDSLIRFRVAHESAQLRARLEQLPETRVRQGVAGAIELECREGKETLLRLLSVLNELQLSPTSLEMIEPNLERVFLHLTGHALRD